MRLKTRVEELEKQIERYEDEKFYILGFLNRLSGYDCRCVDPLPKYRTIVDAVCETIEEIVDKQKLLDEEQQLIVKANDKIRTQASPNYDGLIKSLEERVEKQEEAINELTQMCQTLLLANFNDCMKDLENELKDLFGSKPAKKCKKSTKSSAEKCKKCGESAKSTKKTSKKENK